MQQTLRLLPTLVSETQRVMARAVWALREADPLTAARARGYAMILLGAYLIVGVIWVVLSRGGVDPMGKALGSDFTSFWAASRLALQGRAAEVYDLPTHYAAQQAAFGGAAVGDAAFFYPPVYILVCLPLGFVPYLPALAAWLLATGAAYWRVARAWLGDRPGLALPIFAFPAVFLNIGHGQNAFLTTAIYGAGLLMLKRRPLVGGATLGSLIFKPQFGLILPIAFLARGRWRAAIGAAAAVLALCGLSWIVFGGASWRAFLSGSAMARATLEQNLVGNEKMVSVFAAARLWGASLGIAYAAQAVSSLAAATFLVRFLRRRPEPRAEGAAIATAALLVSPFLLDYDLTLVALPLAWVFGEASRKGWLGWEKLILLLGFLLPILARGAAGRLGLPLGPPVVFALLWCVVRRGERMLTDT